MAINERISTFTPPSPEISICKNKLISMSTKGHSPFREGLTAYRYGSTFACLF